MTTLTKEQFEASYAAGSGSTVEELHERGRAATPCDCGDDTCRGWQMAHLPLTKSQFIDLNDIPDGMMVSPCYCGGDSCSGWHIVPRPVKRNLLLHMTREEFAAWYEKNAGVIQPGESIVACECEHKGCVGWRVEEVE